MRARSLDTLTGTFLSQDPAKQGGNWASYCGGNPVNRVDPTGKFFFGDMLWGTADEATAENVAAANARLAGQWGENAVQKILTKWADKFAKALWDDGSFTRSLISDAENGGWRLDLVGVDGRYRIAIDLTHDVPHVNCYGWNYPHFTAIADLWPFW